MPRAKFIIPLTFILLAGVIDANSRVAFSRPGNMMRVPNMDVNMYKNLLAVNVSSEYLSSRQSSSAFSVNTMGKSGYHYGLSFVRPVNPANSGELGFHLQKFSKLKYTLHKIITKLTLKLFLHPRPTRYPKLASPK